MSLARGVAITYHHTTIIAHRIIVVIVIFPVVGIFSERRHTALWAVVEGAGTIFAQIQLFAALFVFTLVNEATV